LIKAIDEVFSQSLRIRCWLHRMRNLSNKLPPEVVAIRDSLTYEEGKERLENLVKKYQHDYPSFIHCLAYDSDALLNVLKLPYRHRKTIRNTNLVERMFVEERRRITVIPQFLTEKSCLSLVFHVLYRPLAYMESNFAGVRRLLGLGCEQGVAQRLGPLRFG
jgi:putative transposase